MSDGEKLIPINIEDEMKSAYIDYSMSVIVSRALPDVRDGLKPVHRRVLYGMYDLGVFSNRAHKKSARIVGEVLGKYHPHGDTSVYDAMVRMAQEWSLRYLLIDGQGNFGSVDGDSPAAMRYTEARMKKMSEDIMADIDKETVDFQLNFDDTLYEPKVMPTRVPNLLINGASGIAVGMATNMAPHNLTEVIDGTLAYIDNEEIEIDELMNHVKAPDFPTGGVIYGYDGVREAFKTGRGRIVMRAKVGFEEVNGKEAIIVSEIPYQVNKAEMIKKTADLINEKRIEGISNIRDESDRSGMRIVYELKRDAVPNVVLNTLYKFTQLQSSFSVNNIALVNGRPQMLNLKDLIHYFVEHRHDVVVRRTQFELRKAEERAHILEGLIIASDNIDEVIKIIRASKDGDEARTNLIERFKLSEIQARAIVEMRLRQLTGLEQDKLRAEYEEIMKLIAYLKELLASKEMRMQVIKDELAEVRDKYGDERRSQIEYSGGDVSIEDLIADESVVITISQMQLKRLLKQVEFAMAQQDIRYYLNGLLFEVNGNQLNIVGTDGHRLSFTSIHLDQNYNKTEVILPRKTVIELIKLLNETEELVSVELYKGQVSFNFNDIQLISKVIDGKFPDYTRVVPEGHNNQFTIDRSQFLTSLQRASILSNEKYRGIRMMIADNNLKLISTNTEQEEAEEELEIQYQQDPIDIGFNVTYLIDVLTNIQEDKVTLAFLDTNSSCLFTIPNNNDYKYVVMPMRI